MIVSLSSAVAYPQEPNFLDLGGEEIISKAIEKRRQWKQMRVAIDQKRTEGGSSTTVKLLMFRDYQLNRSRTDLTDELGNTTTTCINGVEDGVLTRHTNRKPSEDPDGEMVLEIRDTHRIDEVWALEIDPRVFGFVPIDTMNYAHYKLGHLENLLTRNPLTVTWVNLGGESCFRVDSMDQDLFGTSVWIAPEKGFSVLKSRFRTLVADGTEIVDELLCSGVKEHAFGVWFPEKMEFSRSTNGTPTIQALTEITQVQIQDAISPGTFSIASMPTVHPGTVVLWDRDAPRPVADGQLEWSGSEIIAKKNDTVAFVPTGGSSKRSLFFALSTLVLIIGILLLVRRK